MTYGANIAWMCRQAGNYIGQILKGARPAEMPVMQATHFEVLNLQMARRRGIAVPPTVMAAVDELIL